MAYRLKFAGRAVREIGEAFDWYEEQSIGLGSEFELAFELQLKRLEQVPLLYAAIVPGVRRTLLPRLPYGVFYTVKNNLVQVEHDWVVYAKTPLGGPAQVLEYLSRDTHRSAFSNERIRHFEVLASALQRGQAGGGAAAYSEIGLG